MQYGDASRLMYTACITVMRMFSYMRAGSDEEGLALMLMYSTNRTVRRKPPMSTYSSTYISKY